MRLRSQAAVLVLAFALAAPWAAAADPRIRDRADHPVVSVSEFLSHAWDVFTSLWGAASACDPGLGTDPLGCPAQPTTDAGLGMDPLG